MTAYYNENHPYAAQWLRNLIDAGHIAPGIVDERSIEDVYPSDIRGFAQCHFFAGIGGWSAALRAAGWPDDRPVWTGSCPCQPFSAAGEGSGFADERHLWPAWFHLIRECHPGRIYGEQVASGAALTWVDLVQADLEGANYASWATDLCAASVGAPHIRQRLYWLADAVAGGSFDGRRDARGRYVALEPDRPGAAGWLADAGDDGLRGLRGRGLDSGGQPRSHVDEPDEGDRHSMGDPTQLGLGEGHGRSDPAGGRRPGSADAGILGVAHASGQGLSDSEREAILGTRRGHEGRAAEQRGRSFWADAEWILCRDGRRRPIEPGSFPLAYGPAGRVGRVRADQERLAALAPRKDQGSRRGRLHAYGNAIVVPLAAEFVRLTA